MNKSTKDMPNKGNVNNASNMLYYLPETMIRKDSARVAIEACINAWAKELGSYNK